MILGLLFIIAYVVVCIILAKGDKYEPKPVDPAQEAREAATARRVSSPLGLITLAVLLSRKDRHDQR